MTNETDEVVDRRVRAVEDYAEALRNWDKVHAAFKRNELGISREDDIAAWNRREAAFNELKRIEAELESDRPE